MKKDYGNTAREKESVRRRIWDEMLRTGVARFPLPPHGRIPNFSNTERCASHLSNLKEWRRAETVKINPDSPQKSVRLRALLDGKVLVMPTPRIRQGFIILDPDSIPDSKMSDAVTIRGAFRCGEVLSTVRDVRRIERIDMIVEGSVAVNVHGERLGKGEGYGDLEFAILAELGIIEREVPVITTVHGIQLVSETLPQSPHDVTVDCIITPDRVIKVRNRPGRPSGIITHTLDRRKVREIPILKELLHGRL